MQFESVIWSSGRAPPRTGAARAEAQEAAAQARAEAQAAAARRGPRRRRSGAGAAGCAGQIREQKFSTAFHVGGRAGPDIVVAAGVPATVERRDNPTHVST